MICIRYFDCVSKKHNLPRAFKWNIAVKGVYQYVYEPHPTIPNSQPNANYVYNPRDVLYVDIEG